MRMGYCTPFSTLALGLILALAAGAYGYLKSRPT
jgi:hypothetical protein